MSPWPVSLLRTARKTTTLLSSSFTRFYKTNSSAIMDEAAVRATWRSADAVCFDVDSTLCTDEAIDELAAYLKVGKMVQELTNQAMGGTMTFKESLAKRLSIIRPSQQDVTQFIRDHTPSLTPGIRELVSLLQSRGVPIYLISGGFQSIIERVAQELNIPKEHIYANRFVFYHDGGFAGFDPNQATCQAGGKPRVIKELKETHGYQRLVHVGDGVTDMEACPPADAFIGFGGNKIRDQVKRGSPWFATSIQEMIDELNKTS